MATVTKMWTAASILHKNQPSRVITSQLHIRTPASRIISNNESHLGNVIAGTFFGSLAGGGLGLGACMFLFDDPPFFTGDTVLVGAIVCGLLGFFLGGDFIEWLKENWWGFWW